MERNPEQNKNPHLYDNCDHCEEDYDLTPENTAIRMFTKKPECDYVFAVCPHCSGRTRIYPQTTTLEALISIGITPVIDDYPDQEEYLSFCHVYGIELIEPKELTPRQDRYINNHGLFLQHVEVTVEDFRGRR